MSWWLLCNDLVVLNFIPETFFLLVLNFHFKGGNWQVIISSSPVFSGILHAEGTPLDVAGVELVLLGPPEKQAAFPSLDKKRRHGRRKSVYYDDFRKKNLISQITSLLFMFLKP